MSNINHVAKNHIANNRASQNLIVALLAAATFLMSLGSLEARAQQTPDLMVTYDQSQILRLPRRVSEIIIGNPSIAEITISSGKMLVITGKAFGITNLILLDEQKNIMLSRRLITLRPTAKVVNLMRGGGRQTYNCTPQCNPTLVIGDSTGYFNSLKAASQAKNGMAHSAATKGAQASE